LDFISKLAKKIYMRIQKKVSAKLKCIVSKSFLDFLCVHMAP